MLHRVTVCCRSLLLCLNCALNPVQCQCWRGAWSFSEVSGSGMCVCLKKGQPSKGHHTIAQLGWLYTIIVTEDLLSLIPVMSTCQCHWECGTVMEVKKMQQKTPLEGNHSRRGTQVYLCINTCSTWHQLFAQRATHPTMLAAPQPSAGLTAGSEARILLPLVLLPAPGKLVNLTSGNGGDRSVFALGMLTAVPSQLFCAHLCYLLSPAH